MRGVTPGKGGTQYSGNEKDPLPAPVPVFNTVADAVAADHSANTSVMFVPAAFAADAIMEAADAGIGLDRLHHGRHPDAGHAARL